MVVADPPTSQTQDGAATIGARLDLVSLSASFLEASLRAASSGSGSGPSSASLAELSALLGATVPEAWLEHESIMRLRLEELRRDSSLQPWLLRAMVRRPVGEMDRHMVGFIGFHGPPGSPQLEAQAPGAVELGYTVFAPYRRQGFAEESCRVLMDWAHAMHRVNHFVVAVSPTNLPSLRLAAKLGFARVGEQVDEEDGLELIFLLTRPQTLR